MTPVCAFCVRDSIMAIPVGRVCATHAEEFYRGLVAEGSRLFRQRERVEAVIATAQAAERRRSSAAA